jgi:hypothetical protein
LTHKSSGHSLGKSTLDTSNHTKEKNVDAASDGRRGFFAKRRNHISDSRKDINSEKSSTAKSSKSRMENTMPDRPAFHSDLHGQSTSNSKLQPRAVAIPYSRFKKERFYDWPPDPTVSRATPITLHPEEPTDHDDSLSTSVPDFPLLELDENHEFHSSLRKRHSTTLQCASDIPDSIAF